MSRRGYAACTALTVPVAVALLLIHNLAGAAEKPNSCIPVARLVSIQGALQILRAGQTQWSYVRKLDTILCQGDLLHAGPRSRAALLISPETLVRLDQSTTLSVSQTQDETIVEFAKDPGLFERILSAPNPCGAGYFITRFPRKFRVLTPFINASVEGTEFLVAMRCESAQIAVFEGRVLAQDIQSSSSHAFTLARGEALEAGTGQPAAVKFIVKPVDAVQWALYYPPITEPAGDAVADQKCDQTDPAARSVCILQRAEQRLRSGRVEEAEGDIQTLLNLGLGGGDAYALLAIISVVKNDKAQALELAARATQVSPSSPRAWLALSYAQQAAFELDKALAAAKKAAALVPASSLAQARVAELLMSSGYIREAEKAAQAAVKANPNDARAHMVLGFAHLTQIDTKKAKQDFLTAIELDSTEPLARLGLGLAAIRDGHLKDGREQLEIAVILDPANSLLRSYVGKAYYEENTSARDQLAGTEYGIAKKLDPRDPTPWFYDAILKQSQNRPVEAMEDLQKSAELNDDRAVYRSRLLLDQDLATREMSLGTVYRDLGFESLGWVQGVRALNADPTNYSAHRLLSDLDAAAPRFEVARVSELLQSQLLQPLTLNAIQPRLAESDLVALDRVGPWDPSFNEYTSLFASDRFSVSLNLLGGSNDTVGEELTLAAVQDRFSIAAGNFYYKTDGFRENDDYKDQILGAFGQVALSDWTNFQVEVRTRNLDHGDISLRLSDPSFFPANRRSLDTDTGRFGFHHRFRPGSDLLLSWISQRRTETLHLEQPVNDPDAGPLIFEDDLTRTDDASLSEVQYLQQWKSVQLIVGAGYADSDAFQHETFAFVPRDPPSSETLDFSTTQGTAYAYFYLRPSASFTLIGGASAANYRRQDLKRSQVNPKIGAVLQATPSTTLRAAAFRTLKRELVTDQTLEPTQVAGFNQFFDDINATDAWRVGMAVDQRFGRSLWGGIELSARWLTGPLDNPATDTNQDQVLNRAYLYWVPARQLALGVDYQFQGFNRETPPLDSTIPDSLRTAYGAFTAAFYPSGWFFAKLRATHVSQNARFIDTDTGAATNTGDNFWIVDASIGVRMPRRWGIFSVGVTNLFDTHFRFQDLNSVTNQDRLPPFVPERQVFARVNLAF